MRPNEAWLFKQFDTRDDGRAKQTFHDSFHDPFHDQDPNTPVRRSAEFRLLLTFPKRRKIFIFQQSTSRSNQFSFVMEKAQIQLIRSPLLTTRVGDCKWTEEYLLSTADLSSENTISEIRFTEKLHKY